MLITNYNRSFPTNTYNVGGQLNPTAWFNHGRLLMFPYGDASVSGTTDENGLFHGYRHPYSVVMAMKTGGISSVNNAQGVGALSGSGALGRNIESALAGIGSLSGTGQLIVSAVATLAGSGAITSAEGKAFLNASATLAGSGAITASIKALGNAIATIGGVGAVSPTIKALGNIEADIQIGASDPLSPQALAAYLWNSLASEFNEAGTMGEKLNDAGSAGNPWAADATTNNDPGTMGEKLNKTLTTGKFIALK